jgi:hypothetical protein
MKKRSLHPLKWFTIIIIVTILCNPMSNLAADINGKWKAEFETQIGIQKYTFTFKLDEGILSGTATSDIGGNIQEVVLTDVKLDSNKISFVEMLSFQGMGLRISYDGIVMEDEMKLNRHVAEFVTEELVAKREQ